MQDYTSYKAEDLLLDESFIQYCLGNEEASALWYGLLKKYPELVAEAAKAKEMHRMLAIRLSADEKKIELQKLKAAIHTEKQKVITMPEAPVHSIAPAKRWAIGKLAAAAVLIGVIVTAAFLYTKEQIYNIGNTPVAAFAKARFNEVIQSRDDQRKEITLPDGSVVTLNYGSTLKLADDYNTSRRWVYLEGEAFFSVKPDKSKPFTVITGKNATTALGTSFKVRDYAGEMISDVMLATGKVRVQSMQDPTAKGDVILLPGGKASCEKNNLPVKAAFDMNVLQNWRNLKIEFNKSNLENIIATLQFNYGVQVNLQNKPSKEIAFTGRFTNESLHDVLEAISFTNKFSYTQKGNFVSVLFQ